MRHTGTGTRLAAMLLAAAGLVALAGAPARADDKVNLKISLWVPPAHPLVGTTQAWAKSMEQDSGGSITATVFPSEQLGKAFDHYDMARDGIADLAYVNPGYQPGRFPIINASQLPFYVSDARKGSVAVDNWYRKYAAREMPDTHYCLAFVQDPGTIHSRKKIVLPTDLKGVKVRPAQSMIGEWVTQLGGTNVQASAPESRDMLERGVADAIFFPWGSIFLFGIDKVVKYHIDAPLYTTVFTWSMNKAVYDHMSPAQQKVIDNHCNAEWAARMGGEWGDFEAAGRAKMRAAPGHEVYTLTPEQTDAWKQAAKPLEASWANQVRKVGGDPDTILAELKQQLVATGGGNP